MQGCEPLISKLIENVIASTTCTCKSKLKLFSMGSVTPIKKCVLCSASSNSWVKAFHDTLNYLIGSRSLQILSLSSRFWNIFTPVGVSHIWFIQSAVKLLDETKNGDNGSIHVCIIPENCK